MARIRTIILNDNDLQVSILNTGEMEVREVILKNDVPVYHRRIIVPGDSDAEESPRMQDVMATYHTSAVKTSYQAMRAARFDEGTIETREPAQRQTLATRIRNLFRRG